MELPYAGSPQGLGGSRGPCSDGGEGSLGGAGLAARAGRGFGPHGGCTGWGLSKLRLALLGTPGETICGAGFHEHGSPAVGLPEPASCKGGGTRVYAPGAGLPHGRRRPWAWRLGWAARRTRPG